MKTAAKAVARKSKKTETETNSRASLGLLKGFSAVRIIRQLGKEGLTPKEIFTGLTVNGINPNMHTVYLQSGVGRRGEKAPIATLSKNDIKLLKAGKKLTPEKAAKKMKEKAAATEEAPKQQEETVTA